MSLVGPGDMGSAQYWHRQSFPLNVTLSPAGNGRLQVIKVNYLHITIYDHASTIKGASRDTYSFWHLMIPNIYLMFITLHCDILLKTFKIKILPHMGLYSSIAISAVKRRDTVIYHKNINTEVLLSRSMHFSHKKTKNKKQLLKRN